MRFVGGMLAAFLCAVTCLIVAPIETYAEVPDDASAAGGYTVKMEDGTTVTVVPDDEATIPEGAKLNAEKIADGDSLRELSDAVKTALNIRQGEYPLFFPCDIYFTDAYGERFEPDGITRVTVQFNGGHFGESGSKRSVVHVRDSGVLEKLDAEWTGDGTVTFDTLGLSVFGVVSSYDGFSLMSVDDSDGDNVVQWGTVLGVTTSDDEQKVRTWDVSSTKRRYVEIPVEINVSGTEDTVITLPRYIDGNIRAESAKVECKHSGIVWDGWSVEEEDQNVVITCSGSSEGGSHRSAMVTYRFDCWDVVSNREFTLDYSVKKGSESTPGTLKGKITTGHSVAFDDYFYSWGDSGYSLSALGGADKYMAYIPKWGQAYQKYFGLEKDSFNGDTYLYDVAPYLVRPEGQQPYDISGTISLDQGGEVIGAVYMMDSFKGSDAPWKKLTVTNGNVSGDNKTYTFTLSHDTTFEEPNSTTALEKKVVTGNLEDQVDSKNYTLYFLVRYPKDKLQKKDQTGAVKADGKIIEMNATLNLTHRGVDSHTDKSATGKATLYKGQMVDAQIYWASYVNNNVSNRKALAALKKESTATLDFAADFFCLNEARKDFNESQPDKYKMVAVIDLSYLTSSETALNKSPQLTANDYRFSSFSLSLVDTAGSWSQDWNYQNDENGGWRGTPNVGWTKDVWNNPSLASGDIKVYGSTSLDGDTWDAIETVAASSVWAKNQDRDMVGEKHTIGQDKKYLRLKVEYESSKTTALRVGYQIELQPSLLANHNIQNKETQQMTCWFNYMAYKGTAADTTYMKFQRYPANDGTGWEANTAGTIELARQYDKKLTNYTKYNNSDDVWAEAYSMRNFAKATLGSDSDSAGMLVTQALYDSAGSIVGDATSTDYATKDASYSRKDTVINVSEIVYNLTGAITDGSPSLEDLEAYRKLFDEQSAYQSLKMRYYVLLPQGMKLNDDPDEGHQKDEHDYPKFHFWTKGSDENLSAGSVFYNNNSNKRVQNGEGDIPVSAANIPGYKDKSGNGALSEMYWVGNDSSDVIKVNKDLSKGRLVVFERELSPASLSERFNMWGPLGTETYFWGRGLSFSAVPTGGVGTLPAGTYTTHVWCQYLNGQDQPISLDGFGKGTEDVQESLLGGYAGEVQKDSLLYIPIEFTNRSASGSTSASIALDSESTDEYGAPVVEFGKPYKYKLEYSVDSQKSKNAVLWANIEDKNGENPEYHGTIEGVDLSSLPGEVKSKTKVYVKNDYITQEEYTASSNQAKQSWLTDEQHGWTAVENPDNYDHWADAKAVAFSFGDFEFNVANTKSATVYVKMQAPDDEGYKSQADPGENVEFSAVSPLLFSDNHQKDSGWAESCAAANRVPVSVSVTGDPELTLDKSADKEEAARGEEIHYTLTVTNDNAPVTNAVVTDAIPEGLTVNPESVKAMKDGAEVEGATSSVEGQTLRVNLGDLDANDVVTITYTATVNDEEALEGQTLKNTATVTSNETDPVSDTWDVDVPFTPTLGIEKRADKSEAARKAEVNYTLTVTVGKADLTDVVVTDKIPEGLTVKPESVKVSKADTPMEDVTSRVDGQTLTVELGNLDANDVVTITYKATVVDDAVYEGQTLTNTATVDSNETPEASATWNVRVPYTPTLGIEKSADKSVARKGEKVNYTLKVSVGKVNLTNVIVTDAIPDGLTVDEESVKASIGDRDLDSATSSVEGQTLRVNLGNLDADSVVTITYTATVADDEAYEGQTLHNVATADSDQTDSVQDDWNVNVPHTPTVEFDKSADKSVARKGDTVNYTLKVSVGKANLTNVVVTDEIDEGLTVNEGSIKALVDGSPVEGATSRVDGQTLTVELGDLDANDVVTITYTATVADDDAVVGKTLHNVATLTSDQTDDLTDTWDVTVPTLELEKSADKSVVALGGNVSYRLALTVGDANLTNVVVTDDIPDGISVDVESVSATKDGEEIEGAEASLEGSTLTIELGDLNAHDEVEITYTATVDDDEAFEGKTLTNTATATSDQTDSVQDDWDVVVPKLGIDKQGDKEAVPLGGDVHYTLTVTNGDGAVTGAVVTDTIPDGLTVDPDSIEVMKGGSPVEGATSRVDGQTLTVNIGDLEAHAVVTITYTATVSDDAALEGTTLTNTATVDSNETPPHEDTWDVDVSYAPELGIEKVADKQEAARGDEIHYTLMVTNGNAPVTNAVVTDAIPEGLTVDSASVKAMKDGAEVEGATSSVVDQTLTVNLGNLDAHAVVTITYTATVNDDATLEGTTLHNVAAVTSNETPSYEDEFDVDVPFAPTLELEKNADKTVVALGGTVDYTLSLTVGKRDLANVVVNDDLPEGLTVDSQSVKVLVNGEVDEHVSVEAQGQTLIVELGDLKAHDKVEITYTATVADDASFEGQTLHNVATATSEKTDPVQDDWDVKVPTLGIEKSADASEANPGDEIHYTLTVTNGSGDVTGAVVTDTIPDGLTVDPESVKASMGDTAMENVTSSVDGQTLTVELGDLAADSVVTITYTAMVADDAAYDGQTLHNVATVTSNETPEASATWDVKVSIPDEPEPKPDLPVIDDKPDDTPPTVTTPLEEVAPSVDNTPIESEQPETIVPAAIELAQTGAGVGGVVCAIGAGIIGCAIARRRMGK